MKLKSPLTYNRILDYLKDKLSNRDRHKVEKAHLRDVFEEEAFEGIKNIPVNELERDVAQLQQRIEERINKKSRSALFIVMRVAASIVVLVGLVIAIKITFKNKTEITESKKIAETKEVSVQQLPETAASEPVIIREPLKNNDQLAYQDKKTERKEQTVAMVVDEMVITESSESVVEYQIVEESKIEAEEMPAANSKEVKSELQGKARSLKGDLLKGKVTDEQGEPLIGVTIIEKGTSNGVITDINGEFELKLTNNKSELEFKFIGYVTEELAANEIKDGNVKLVEDIVALDEVVVVGYGVQKKSLNTGAVASVKLDDSESLPEIQSSPAKPPTGTFMSFKKYIYKNLDYSLFSDLTDKQKIQVEFMVYKDGTVGDFQFKQPADERISNEIKKVIIAGGRWKPSTKGVQMIDSKVKMRLVIDSLTKEE